MARKRHSDEDVLKLLREIELKLTGGSDVASACRSVGISDATYYNWRKRFGGMGRSQLSEMKSLEKENSRLKKIVAELIWRRLWETRRQAEMAIFEYINGFYNPRRRHSALGWKSPVAFERKVA